MPKSEEGSRRSGSYPSGHTVRGWGMALVLAELNPERQDTLLKAGYEWGQSRVIAGYHWQSDVDASKLLASATFAAMHSNETYREDVAAAREELKALAEADAEAGQAWLRNRRPEPEKHHLVPNRKIAKDSPYKGHKNYGKSIAVFGGSLSVNNESDAAKQQWADLLNAEVTTYGVGGAGFSNKQGYTLQKQVEDAGVYDVYVLWASTNDYNNSRECGTWQDYTVYDNYDPRKLTTQCGGINYCIKTLLEKNPKAEIYFTASRPCWRRIRRRRSTSSPPFASSGPMRATIRTPRPPTRPARPSRTTSRPRRPAAPTTASRCWTSSTCRGSTSSTWTSTIWATSST